MTSTQVTYQNIKQLLADKGEYVSVISGVSMYPMLRFKKDPVLLHPIGRKLTAYDVVLYRKGDQYVLHRILEVCADHCIIRGDNCIGKEFVRKEDIVGLMAGFWRWGRFVSSSNPVYRFYSRIWVAINPLVRIRFRLGHRYAVAKRRLKDIWKTP